MSVVFETDVVDRVTKNV